MTEKQNSHFVENYLQIKKIYTTKGLKVDTTHKIIFFLLNTINVGRHLWGKWAEQSLSQGFWIKLVTIAIITSAVLFVGLSFLMMMLRAFLKIYHEGYARRKGSVLERCQEDVIGMMDKRCSELDENNESDWTLLELFKVYYLDQFTDHTLNRYLLLFVSEALLSWFI